MSTYEEWKKEKTPEELARQLGEDRAYAAPYQAQQDAAVRAVTQRAPFSYDAAADPAYQAYKKEYVREGRRASRDTLGRYAAMTGGVPSTAAVTAASQAGDYYAAKLADKVPELYRLAYEMYADEARRNLDELGALRSLNADDYGRWADAFGRLGTAYRAAAGERDYADAARAREEKADAAKLYAYGGDAPYEIGSAKGRYFVSGAAPGDAMTGGDGSVWRKNGDGSVTITRDGQTWRTAPADAASGGGRSRAAGTKEKGKDAPAAGDGGVDWNSVLALGYGPIGAEKLAALVDSGAVVEYTQGGVRRYRRAGAVDAPLPASFAERVSARLG